MNHEPGEIRLLEPIRIERESLEEKLIANDSLFSLQVIILLTELCKIHNLPIPSDIHNLRTPFNNLPASSQFQDYSHRQNSSNSHASQNNHESAHPQQAMPQLQQNASQYQQPQPMQHDDSEPEEDIEDVVGESDQDSDVEEDLPLELDDGRSSNKVIYRAS